MQLLVFSVVAICIAASFADVINLPPVAIISTGGDLDPTAAPTTTAAASNDKSVDNHDDHEHKIHHEHDATITVDLHNILDLFKQELHALEERLVAAVQHDHASSPATEVKSYRTADR